MTSRVEGTAEENERLLSDGDSAEANPSNADGRSDQATSSSAPPIQMPQERKESGDAAHLQREPVVHYSSLSVNCRFPLSGTSIAGSAQVVEVDLGDENDFWNVHVNFMWKPRGQTPSTSRLGSKGDRAEPLCIPMDEFLTLRLCLDSKPADITIHLRGGKQLGQFSFPNGPDAAMAFMKVLQTHVSTFVLPDSEKPGKLFALESRPRMRKAVPSLTPNETGRDRVDEDYSSLLAGLTLHTPGSLSRRNHEQRTSSRRNRRPALENRDLGMTILSQFAKVTQVARDVGDDISFLLDEKKRRAESDRKERERIARRRALDIYADIVASTDVERELPPRLCLDERRGIAVSKEVWEQSFDDRGILIDPVVMRHAIFAGGVEGNVRGLVWPFILGVFPWTSSQAGRDQIELERKQEYGVLKEKWKSLQESAKDEDAASIENNPEGEITDRRKRISEAHAQYLEVEEQIAKDIVRTDRQMDLYMRDNAPATLVLGNLLNVYATFDEKITYCQGMSDFLSPIVHVLGTDNEGLAFWCFEALMRRIEGNFRVDQSGMRKQLSQLRKLIRLADEGLAAFFEQSDPDYYCCFRWIIVRFRRELPFASTARLWEVMWTRHVGGDNLHIFIAAALLLAHRRQILSLPRGAFDSLLRYINDMSMRIDVDFALREGELCFRKYGELVK